MFLPKYLQWILLIFWVNLILSCKDGRPVKEKALGKRVLLHLEIYSPYGCYNELQLDSAGTGTAIIGFRDDNKNKTEKNKKNFSIGADSDRTKLLGVIDRIQTSPPVYTGYGHDLYHFILTINGHKFFDAYQDSIMTLVLNVLAPYVRFEKEGECDFFNLFKP